MSEDSLIQEAACRLSTMVDNKHVLCLQDSSEVNLTNHDKRIKDKTALGRLDYAKYALGFKLHPSFVLEANSLMPLGFSSIKLWHRPLDMPTRQERNYRDLPIEEKESYKWIESAIKSKGVLSSATKVTFIQDRESDIYEFFCEVPDEKTHLIVRSNYDRVIHQGVHLSEYLAQQPCSGIHAIEVNRDYRTGRTKRTATLEIRYDQVTIKKPNSSHMETAPDEKQLYVVEAKEINPPDGKQKIYWRLFTTHEVQDFSQAIQIIEWYKARWYIEQVFRLLKNKGFQIENSELESGQAIRKLCVMMLVAIVKIMQLRRAYDQADGLEQPIEMVFDTPQVDCLKAVNKTLEGKTDLQKNRHHPSQLCWATWIIARLGGWKGYPSKGPPGIIVLKRGLERFNYIMEGFSLMKDMGTQ